MGKENPRFWEGPGVAYGIRAREGAGNRGLFDHHFLTIGDVVDAGVEWSLNPADGRLTNLVATVVDALHTDLCPTFEDGSVVVEVDAVGVVP